MLQLQECFDWQPTGNFEEWVKGWKKELGL